MKKLRLSEDIVVESKRGIQIIPKGTYITENTGSAEDLGQWGAGSYQIELGPNDEMYTVEWEWERSEGDPSVGVEPTSRGYVTRVLDDMGNDVTSQLSDKSLELLAADIEEPELDVGYDDYEHDDVDPYKNYPPPY